MRFVAILVVLLSCTAVGHAQDLTSHPAKIDDTAALNAAVADIGKLSARQTEALTRALANCWDGMAAGGTTDRAFQECARSHRYFLYITEDNAPIRQMYDSWYIERVVKGTKRDKQRAAMLNRIENAFSVAIIKRFDVLDQERK
ncbi:MAG: hypothetical protein ACM3II_15280 [Rhodospirillaceae bacterium]